MLYLNYEWRARGHEALKKQQEEYSSLMLKEILEWVMQHVKEEQENYFNKSIELYSARERYSLAKDN